MKTEVIGNVQDSIADGGIRDIMKPKEGVLYLHAAGREDIDVRMLGTGRPFIMEIINPTKALSCFEQLKSLSINGPYVFCKDL